MIENGSAAMPAASVNVAQRQVQDERARPEGREAHHHNIR
jgi:hypothetical protein